MGREPDPAGQAAWLQALDNGASHTDVALAVLRSREADEVAVRRLFGRLLGRPADPFGLDAFAGALQQGVPAEEVAARIAESPEYFSHAQ